LSNKYTYDFVKNYIEIESDSGCELISKEYNGVKENLDIKCKCGNDFTTTFDCFKNQNKRQCNTCSGFTNWDLEKVINLFKKYNYEVLFADEYKGNKQKFTLIDKDGYFYYISVEHFLIHTPKKFQKSNPYTIQNIKLWLKINNKQFELLSENFEGAIKNLKWKCLKEECGETFEMIWSNIYNVEHECPFCTGQQVGLSNCLATKNSELAKEWHPTKNDLIPFDVTCGSGKYVWWKCKECGHGWGAMVCDRTSKNKSGCPECNKSKGEKKIDEVLINNNWIKISQEEFNKLIDEDKYSKNYFIPQMKYNDLIGLGGGFLLYDHYIPKLNLLIEYDGEFHYKPIQNYKNEPMEYAEERLRKQQEHDRLKDKYTQNKNINLLRIPYWEFDNIEEILKKYI